MPCSTPKPVVGRFAPSPTGALHTGSLVTAVGSWLMAKSAGGRWLLRIDDLDTARQVPGMADDIMATLESFGLCWDGAVAWQSRNVEAYRDAFDRLTDLGLVYPCGCSRKEISLSASAPLPEDDCLAYTGTCRTGMREGAPVRSWRLIAEDGEICFNDLRRRMVCQNVAQKCGDFALRRGDGEFTYQLAVIVDDHITVVNQVVRGDDLLASTPRQIMLQHLLAYPHPTYCHLPLVTGPDGAKLSKRDNLVSYSLENWKGKEGMLLFGVLRFLGQEPPEELSRAGCYEILQWGSEHFEVEKIPANGGELNLLLRGE
jgi:glutamyl-Q tRNA(Asp) synthetase